VAFDDEDWVLLAAYYLGLYDVSDRALDNGMRRE